MAVPPVFTTGQLLTTAQMNAVGLWLVKTQTISVAATTQDVTSCFTSDYSNYRIVFDGFTASAPIGVTLQFLVGSTPTAVNYYGSGLDISLTGVVTGVATNNGSSGVTQIVGNTTPAGGVLEVFAPAKATRTSWMSGGIDARTNGNPYRSAAGFQDSNTQFSGFRILTGGATTITGGTIRVYGYRD
jgi:hypothetical protein